MATLNLKNITKSFGKAKVLHGIDLAIEDKEFVVFVGPSGCGKSTLLRIVAGLEDATTGQIVIDGRDVSSAHPVDRGISMVFQSYALYPHLTVYENIAFPLRVAKTEAAALDRQVKQAADILQLNDKLDMKPGQLSGGQRQRVAIGRSIVREPKVFLFDEPLSNLDAALRSEMRVELSRLQRSLAATMVYVTHDQVEAMTMADRIVVLNGGRVEQCGTPMELYHHPQTRFVAGFIGQPNMNFVPATVIGTEAGGLAVELPGEHRLVLPVETDGVSAGDRVEVGMRPENVTMGEGFRLDVEVLERLGGVAIAHGRLGDNSPFSASLPGDAIVHEGEALMLSVEPSAAHVFDSEGNVLRRTKAPKLAN